MTVNDPVVLRARVKQQRRRAKIRPVKQSGLTVTSVSGTSLAPVKTGHMQGRELAKKLNASSGNLFTAGSSRPDTLSPQKRSRPQSRASHASSSVDSLLERVSDSGRFASSGVSLYVPVQPYLASSSSRSSRKSSRPVSLRGKASIQVESVLQLWEHRDLSLPRGSRLLNARDTYHSNNIAALFADPRNPDVSTSKGTLAATADLVKMGLLDELCQTNAPVDSLSKDAPSQSHVETYCICRACREESVKTVCGRQGLNS